MVVFVVVVVVVLDVGVIVDVVVIIVLNVDVVVQATSKVDLRLLVMEVEFGWVGVVVCKNCLWLLLVLLGEVAYIFFYKKPITWRVGSTF